LSRFPSYFADVVIVPAIGVNTIFTKVFHANSIFNAEVSGSHDVTGFAQMMDQYFHFTVLYSDIRVEEQQIGLAQQVLATVYQHNALDTVTVVYNTRGVNGLDELTPRSINLIAGVSGIQSNARTTSLLKFSAPATFHKTAANLIGDSRFQGNEGANPTEDAFFTLECHTPTGSASTNGIPYKVTLHYWAVFTEPRWFD